MENDKILVTGATGNVGAEVVKALAARGAPVRAAALDAVDARRVPPGCEDVVFFDFGDPATYGPAFDRVNRLFLMRPPAIGDVAAYLFPVIDYAAAHGVEHVVFLSLIGVEGNRRVPHYAVEQHIAQSGLPHTMLRPSFFMQNLNTIYCEDIRDRGEIFIPAGWGRTSFVDVRDIGQVAAVVLTEPGHLNQAYALTGPEALNYFEVASVFSQVLGRQIVYRKPSFQAYTRRLVELGFPQSYIDVQRMLYLPIRMGLGKRLTAEVERLLGRPPYTMRDYAQAYAEFWQEPSIIQEKELTP